MFNNQLWFYKYFIKIFGNKRCSKQLLPAYYKIWLTSFSIATVHQVSALSFPASVLLYALEYKKIL